MVHMCSNQLIFSEKTEYWKSQDRKFCDFCQCWIADNKPSIQSHENGKRHKESVAKKLAAMSKKSMKQHKESIEIDKDMKRMEEAAMKAYLQDIKSNADFSSQQILKTLEEKGQTHQLDELAAKEDKSSSSGGAKSQKTVQIVKTTKWQEVSSDGKTYYWNVETNETSWEVPAEGFVSLAEQAKEAKEKKAKKKLVKEEIRAFKAREAMKARHGDSGTKGNQTVKEEDKPEPTVTMGPAPKGNPYGGWTTVVREVPRQIDLQLPKTEVTPIVVPAVRESRVGMKEKKLESLDADDVPTQFKKRKLGFKGNIRRRTGSDSD
ncbi:U1 zinc finger [Nesidiocoris tenuis]|uniref:U1 zinc finger n=1 Tax=Nesidiocoris tenuis TaxID=355587 RepID=A0ABN7AQ28_9HEMI|nr:U1 zinc finger [Nesidiocoris tenuis]